MNTLINMLDHVRNYKHAYLNICNKQLLGGMKTWSEYLKSKRIYKGETHREMMRRLSEAYNADLRNNQLLKVLSRIENNLLVMIDKLGHGIPVPREAIVEHVERVKSLPKEIMEPLVPKPPPPPPPQRDIKEILKSKTYTPKDIYIPPTMSQLSEMLGKLRRVK